MNLSKRKFLLSAGAGVATSMMAQGVRAQNTPCTPVSSADWDREVDIVIVGAGIGGLSAAISAYDAGLRPLIIEKMDWLGGVTSYSHGLVWVPGNFLQKEAGVEDDVERGMRYVEFVSGGYGDPQLRTRLLEMAPVALEYMVKNAGLRFKITPQPDYWYPLHPAAAREGRVLETEPFDSGVLGEWRGRTAKGSPHVPLGFTPTELYAGASAEARQRAQVRAQNDIRTFGAGLMAYFAKAALIDRKIPALTGMRAESLVRDPNGPIRGIVVHDTARNVRIRIGTRRGVVLAAGGYDWNKRLLKTFEQMPRVSSLSPPSVEGDGMIMATEIGAAIAAVPPYNLGNMLGYQVPNRKNEGREFWTFGGGGGPHSILVNRDGERFCDESFSRNIDPALRIWDGTRQQFRNLPSYLVMDQNNPARAAGGELPPGMVRGDSLEDLARQLRIDPRGLATTVERFNQFCRDGRDADFERDKVARAHAAIDPKYKFVSSLAPIEKAPFFGQELTLVFGGLNVAGLQTDVNAQVVDVRGKAIPGLYAVGNCAAWSELGGGMQSGLPNARGLTWGFIAGRHAADRARLKEGLRDSESATERAGA